MNEKEYWFEIKGKIYAKDRDDAEEQIRQMAIVGKNCERAFYKILELFDENEEYPIKRKTKKVI